MNGLPTDLARVRPAGHGGLGNDGAVTDANWRTLQYFAVARVLVASALMLSVAALRGSPDSAVLSQQTLSPLAFAASVAYFVLAAAMALMVFYLRKRFMAHVAGQLAVDLLLIGLLVTGGGGLRGGVMVLYLLPLAGASLLLPTSAAFFVCALAVLTLLADAFLRALGAQADSLIFQTGVYGAALFAVTGLLRLLSARLVVQERLAQQRGRHLENQLEINRLVIAQMEQGVIVVDAHTRVRANNRSSRILLGLGPNTQLTGRLLADFPTLRPLAEAFMRWHQAERSTGVWSNTILQPLAVPDGSGTPVSDRFASSPSAGGLQLRARFARPPSDTGDEFVIFLEDVRAVEERAQQLKLAAMGRLTASIAHEIRNPLAAISHAGQMLAEEPGSPLQQRLGGIVRENTQRLNRLVEDVLRVARREAPLGDEIELAPFVRTWLDEFIRDRNVAPGRIIITAEASLVVKFEQSHLRQVLFNLIDNALRYASERIGGVEFVIERAVDDAGRVRLWVFDDGPGVPPEVRSALFEPFYTTHARGTGLGLYIAREFCVANRCELAYASRRNFDGSSRDGFVLRFGRNAGGSAEELGFLDTIPVQ